MTLSLPETLENGTAIDAVELTAMFNAIVAWANTEAIRRTGEVAMTADLLLSGDPVAALAAATKQYVDASVPIGTMLPFAGATLPSSGRWLWALGALVSKTTYADLWTLLGSTYGTATATQFYLPNTSSRFVTGKGSASFSNVLGETGGSSTATLVSHSHTDGSLVVDVNHDHGAFNVAMPTHTHTDGVGGNFVMTGTGGDGPDNFPASGGGGSVYTYSHQSVTGGFPGTAPNISVNVPALGATSKSVTGSTDPAGSSSTNANLPPYITLNWIIKVL